MKGDVGRLIKHSGVYGLGSILSKSVGFLMIPVYTRYLAPRDYGVLEILDLTLFFGGIFSMMGIHVAVYRFYNEYTSEKDKREVISAGLVGVAASAFIVALILQIIAGPLADLAFGNPTLAPLVRTVAFTLLFSNLSEVPIAYWRVRHQTVLYVLVGLVRTIVGAGFILIALVVLEKGVEGVVYANLISNCLFGLVMFGRTWLAVRGRISRDKLEQMVRYSLPLIAQSIASFVLAFSDRFFLRHFGSLADVGVYSLGCKLASVVTLLVSGPFTMTWSWQQFEVAQKAEGRDVYAKVQTYQLLVSTSVALAASVLAKDILRVMTPASYWEAAAVVPLIALSAVINGMRSVFLSGIYVKKSTLTLAVIGIVAAIMNLGLNYLLIPKYLAMGAAIATVISYAQNTLFSFWVAQKKHYVPYEYGRNFIILLAAAATYLLSTTYKLPVVPSISLGLLLLAAFFGVAVAVLSSEERSMFLSIGKDIVKRVTNFRSQAVPT